MVQISKSLRHVSYGYGHWCPGCEEMHVIPDSWSFDGNIDVPTFNPSVKLDGVQRTMKGGKWVGGWERDKAGNLVKYCCHYHLHSGQLIFCSDCTHSFSGKTVPLPDLPTEFCNPVIDK